MTFLRFASIAVLTVLMGGVRAQERRSTGDYLSPELRARVDGLVKSASVPTRDADELLARFRTLWEWGNAFALERGRIPDACSQ